MREQKIRVVELGDRYRLIEYHAGSSYGNAFTSTLWAFLPKTKQGNQHILVMVDQFTKWVEVIPLPSQDGRSDSPGSSQLVLFQVLGSHSLNIFSDQGRNFESELFSALCRVLQIHKKRTTPYRAFCEWPSRAIQSYNHGCHPLLCR